MLEAEYYGETRDGQPHGVGYKRWGDGSWYFGEWVDGIEQTVRRASSRYVWANGCEYIGTFSKGKRHGQGTKTWPDGTKYHSLAHS